MEEWAPEDTASNAATITRRRERRICGPHIGRADLRNCKTASLTRERSRCCQAQNSAVGGQDHTSCRGEFRTPAQIPALPWHDQPRMTTHSGSAAVTPGFRTKRPSNPHRAATARARLATTASHDERRHTQVDPDRQEILDNGRQRPTAECRVKPQRVEHPWKGHRGPCGGRARGQYGHAH